MIQFFAGSVAALCLALAASPLAATEIVGQVGAVDGKQIAILITGEFEPRSGDRFTVSVDVPGVGEAVIAHGQIVDMDGGIAIGSIDSATGKIAEGHRVRIDSPDPVKKMGAGPPDPEPVTGQIGAVAGREITIVTTSQTPPTVGDRVEVTAAGPDGVPSVIGIGQVTACSDGLVTAHIGELTGSLAFGQQTRIIPAGTSPAGGDVVTGMKIDPVDAAVAELLDLPSVAGLVIRSVTAGSDGDRAGLKKRDVLLRAGGVALKDAAGFLEAVSRGPGVVKLDVWRDGAEVALELVVSTGPTARAGTPAGPPASNPDAVDSWTGLFLDNHRDFVRVRAVIPGSPAARAGLLPGDRLKSVEGTEVTGRAEAFSRLRGIPVGSSGSVEVLRSGTPLTAVLAPEPRITDEQLFASMNRLAEAGDPVAAHEVGMMWLRGQGVPARNPEEAVRWLRIAAEGGHPQGQFQLGFQLIHAEGNAANPAEGAEWIRRSAEQDDPDAALLLARLHQSGYGVTQSDSEARRWYQVSLAQGSLGGLVEVARMQRAGILFGKDEQKAAELFRIAAERDSTTGQREWGLCLRDGVGVARDTVKSAEWLRLAAKSGDGPARAALEEMGEPPAGGAQSPAPRSTLSPQPVQSPVPQASRSVRLVPAESDRQAIRALAEALPREHYSSHPLDDEIADRTLQLFVETLDPAKDHFFQQDLDGFRNQYRSLDDQLKQGDLTLAMEIFGVYLDRVLANLAIDQELLDQGLEFAEDDWLIPADRFAGNDQERRDRRRKLVKLQFLNHLSAGADDGEAKQRVQDAIRRQRDIFGKYDSGHVTEWLGEALCDAFDPGTSFYPARKLQDRIVGLAGELVGVGMSLESRDGYTHVTKVIPNGPAAATGAFQPGDRIVAVGEGDDGAWVDVVGLPLSDVVARIRGSRGTRVRLRVIPKGAFEATVTALQRDRVDVSSFGSALLTGDILGDRPGCRIGYIYLPTFTTSGADADPGHGTFAHVKRELEAFRKAGAESVVLDLRDNYGGSLQDSIRVCGLFLGPDAIVTQLKSRDGAIDQYRATDVQAAWDGPVVVLTSSNSAGGAEILAAAIQDHRAGLVIGDDRTVGQGTVTSAVELNPVGNAADKTVLGRIEVVTAKFYRANGDGLQQRGVTPDVVFPSVSSLRSSADRQPHRFALPFDQVPSTAVPPRANGPEPAWLETLSQQSIARRSASEWFQNLAGEISRSSQRPGEISLKRETFLADKAREDSLAARGSEIPGIPEISLNGYLREALMIALDCSARCHYRSAEGWIGKSRVREAIQSYAVAVASDPGYAEAKNKLAWTLSTCSDRSLRDGPRARELAEKANQLSGGTNWRYLLTLSLATAEAKDFETARKHLKTALDAAPASERARYQYLDQRFQQRQTFEPR